MGANACHPRGTWSPQHRDEGAAVTARMDEAEFHGLEELANKHCFLVAFWDKSPSESGTDVLPYRTRIPRDPLGAPRRSRGAQEIQSSDPDVYGGRWWE